MSTQLIRRPGPDYRVMTELGNNGVIVTVLGDHTQVGPFAERGKNVLRTGRSPDPSSTRHSRPQIHKDNSYITKRAPYRGKPAANLRRESRAVTLRGRTRGGVRPVQTIKETPTTTKERATASSA